MSNNSFRRQTRAVSCCAGLLLLAAVVPAQAQMQSEWQTPNGRDAETEQISNQSTYQPPQQPALTPGKGWTPQKKFSSAPAQQVQQAQPQMQMQGGGEDFPDNNAMGWADTPKRTHNGLGAQGAVPQASSAGSAFQAGQAAPQSDWTLPPAQAGERWQQGMQQGVQQQMKSMGMPMPTAQKPAAKPATTQAKAAAKPIQHRATLAQPQMNGHVSQNANAAFPTSQFNPQMGGMGMPMGGMGTMGGGMPGGMNQMAAGGMNPMGGGMGGGMNPMAVGGMNPMAGGMNPMGGGGMNSMAGAMGGGMNPMGGAMGVMNPMAGGVAGGMNPMGGAMGGGMNPMAGAMGGMGGGMNPMGGGMNPMAGGMGGMSPMGGGMSPMGGGMGGMGAMGALGALMGGGGGPNSSPFDAIGKAIKGAADMGLIPGSASQGTPNAPPGYDPNTGMYGPTGSQPYPMGGGGQSYPVGNSGGDRVSSGRITQSRGQSLGQQVNKVPGVKAGKTISRAVNRGINRNLNYAINSAAQRGITRALWGF